MSIPVTCQCGHLTRVRTELAGKQLECPACGRICPVPFSEGADSRLHAPGEFLCLLCRTRLPSGTMVCPGCGQDTTSGVPPGSVVRPEREIGLICVAVVLFPLLLGTIGLWVTDASTAVWIALVAIVFAQIILVGTRTRFDILRQADGPRLRQRFSVAWVPFNCRETKLLPIRTARIAYEECHIKPQSWILVLVLGLYGILPGLIYAYHLALQHSHDAEGYNTHGAAYEMHFISLADGDGHVLETLQFRRENQAREMISMLASAVDIDIERD